MQTVGARNNLQKTPPVTKRLLQWATGISAPEKEIVATADYGLDMPFLFHMDIPAPVAYHCVCTPQRRKWDHSGANGAQG